MNCSFNFFFFLLHFLILEAVEPCVESDFIFCLSGDSVYKTFTSLRAGFYLRDGVKRSSAVVQ